MRSNARRALALTAIAFAGLAAAPAKAENFAFMLAANNDIGVLGLSSGSFKLCGNPGVSLTGLGYGPGPVLFSAGRITSSLYTINRTNGAATQVATSNITFLDLGSTVGGHLYALDTSLGLYRVDPTTGAATLIGPTGLGTGGTIAMSSGSRKLYMSQNDALYALNLKKGTAKLVGNGTVPFGAIVRMANRWYGGSNDSSPSLYSISIANGADTLIAPLSGESSNFWGLAPTPKTNRGVCQ